MGRRSLRFKICQANVMIAVPQIMLKIKGMESLTPKIKYKPDNKAVQKGEEVDEVKPVLFMPQESYFTKFFAIAMWIYGSSRSYIKLPSFCFKDINKITITVNQYNNIAAING